MSKYENWHPKYFINELLSATSPKIEERDMVSFILDYAQGRADKLQLLQQEISNAKKNYYAESCIAPLLSFIKENPNHPPPEYLLTEYAAQQRILAHSPGEIIEGQLAALMDKIDGVSDEDAKAPSIERDYLSYITILEIMMHRVELEALDAFEKIVEDHILQDREREEHSANTEHIKGGFYQFHFLFLA